jgi:hypothetical protein
MSAIDPPTRLRAMVEISDETDDGVAVVDLHAGGRAGGGA